MSKKSRAHPICHATYVGSNTFAVSDDTTVMLLENSRARRGFTIQVHEKWANGLWAANRDRPGTKFSPPQQGERWEVYLLVVGGGYKLIACPIRKV